MKAVPITGNDFGSIKGDRLFFGESVRPLNYVCPTYQIAPETIFYDGHKDEIRARGYKENAPIAVRVKKNNIVVDEHRLIHPRDPQSCGNAPFVFFYFEQCLSLSSGISRNRSLRHHFQNNDAKLCVSNMTSVSFTQTGLSEDLFL